MVYVGDAASSNDLTYALQYGELQMKDYWVNLGDRNVF